jgi:outer membrane beta-barrel protein
MSRKMKKISVLAPALLALGLMTVGAEKEASAQEIQVTGPLKGAPAVRRLRLYREGRFEIAPSFSATILDEYKRTVLVGGRINYGITDWLAIGVWGGFGAIKSPTGLSEQIDQNSKRDAGSGYNAMNVPGNPGEGRFQKQAAELSYVAMLQLTVVPFRGKFALFQSVFADVDFYLMGGAGTVGTKERADCPTFNDCAADRGDPKMESKTKFAPTWGLGFNFYLSKMISLGVEWRMIPFAWNRAGFDSRGLDQSGNPSSSGKFPDQKIDSQDATYKFNQMMSIYLGFSFPTMPKTTD